jgi:hypothetical protein
VSVRVPALAASCLLALSLPTAAAPAAAESEDGAPPLGRPRLGRLVAVERAWREAGPSEGLELCLTVENQGAETAYEAAVWFELLGGRGPQMERLTLWREPLEPSVLPPGGSGEACFVTPPGARGIFVRLRARWPAPATPAAVPGDVRAPSATRSGAAR